jgi:hypothetical protein
MAPHLIVGTIFLPLGLGLLTGSAWTARSAVDARARAVRADGEVVELVEERSRNSSGSLWAPRVRFRIPDGRSFEFVSSVRTKPPAYAVGDRVAVRYDPDHPSEARIDDWLSWWFLPSLLGALGAVFTIVGSALLWAGWRSRSAASAGRTRVSGSDGHGSLLNAPTARRLTAQVVAIDREPDEDGRSQWVVVAQAQDPTSGQVLVFRSEPFDFDPGMWIAVGRQVTVAYDPDDLDCYEIDLSFLPGRA